MSVGPGQNHNKDHNALQSSKLICREILIDLSRRSVKTEKRKTREEIKHEKGLEIGRWQLIIFNEIKNEVRNISGLHAACTA